MAINIKELTKSKSMKMSDGDVKKVVRNYMVKIISDEYRLGNTRGTKS